MNVRTAISLGGVALCAAVIRPRAAASQQGACPAGGKVEVAWHGTWYPATIKAGPNAARACQISYDGYGSEWDEWVGADRMRRRTAPTAAPAKAPISPASAPLPNGTYDCATGTGTYQHPMIRADGQFDIRGLTYRFRPFGNVTNGYAPYTVGADNAIRWGGPVGGFTLPPSQILETKKTDYGFYVSYRTTPGGYVETMTCNKM